MSRLRLAFMGSPQFAVPSLFALCASDHKVLSVYSQPPRRSGRGQSTKLSPVHKFALEQKIDVRTPAKLNNQVEIDKFESLDLDLAVVVAYGQLLPEIFLRIPRYGCINVHASLLPRWRGAAPIQRAIQFGDLQTGISLMQMEGALDSGPIICQQSIPITLKSTGKSIHDQLSAMGASIAINVLEDLTTSSLVTAPQIERDATYAKKIRPGEGHINWSLPAEEVERMVRAFNPWPTAWCKLDGERIKILGVELDKATGPVGRTLDDELLIGCGFCSVRIKKLQRSGRGALAASDFLRGRPVLRGTVLQ